MSVWQKAMGYFALAISLFLIASLLSTSYSAALYLFAGIAIAWLIVYIVSRVPRLKWLTILVAISVLFVMFIGINVNLLSGPDFGPSFCTPGETTLRTKVTEYNVVIEPNDPSMESFRLLEDVTYDVESLTCEEDQYTATVTVVEQGKELSLSERQVLSSKRGIFIREVRLRPLEGQSELDTTCCPSVETVELNDFPRNSFYEAHGVPEPEVSPYLDTEIIRWENRSDDIVFAYVASPYFLLRNLLEPFIGVSYLSNWVVALGGLIAYPIIVLVIKPVLIDLGKSRLKTLIEKDADD